MIYKDSDLEFHLKRALDEYRQGKDLWASMTKLIKIHEELNKPPENKLLSPLRTLNKDGFTAVACPRLFKVGPMPLSYLDPKDKLQKKISFNSYLGIDSRGTTALSHIRRNFAAKVLDEDGQPAGRGVLSKRSGRLDTSKTSIAGPQYVETKWQIFNKRCNRTYMADDYRSGGFYPRDRKSIFGPSGSDCQRPRKALPFEKKRTLIPIPTPTSSDYLQHTIQD